MKKIPPSEKNRKQMEEILAGGVEGDNLLNLVLQKGMQIIMHELLEAEVTEHLRRGYYERSGGNGCRGYRNGYEPRRIRTGEGVFQIEVPQVRDSAEPFRSKLREFFRGNTGCLEKLAAEMYARGLSTRDIEDAMIEATGDMILSKASVSRVTEILWKEFEGFQQRDLSGYEVEYLFLDAIYERVRKLAGMKEGILVAWGIERSGKKVLLSLQLGNKENYDSWLELLRDMVKRGLRTPVSITSDGAPGAIKAIEAIFPKSLRIRCWVHRMKNFSTKVPPIAWPEIKAEIYQIRDASSYQQGKERADSFIQRYRRTYPTLVTALCDDLEALLAHLKVPVRHRKSVRTTNLIERSFVEERRRTKVIPGFWTEQSCLKLVFSVLMRASARWNQLTMQDMELKQIDSLRKELGIDRNQKITSKTKAKEAASA